MRSIPECEHVSCYRVFLGGSQNVHLELISSVSASFSYSGVRCPILKFSACGVQEWNVTGWNSLMKLAHHEADISDTWT